MRTAICIALVVFLLTACKKSNDGQGINETPNKEGDTYLGNASRLLSKQQEISLDAVNKAIDGNPISSAPVDTLDRRLALYTMDQILHEKEAASSAPVQQFYHSRMEKVVQELQHTQVTKGMKIWRLYNDGFIVRTATVTVCFDFIRGQNTGSQQFAMPNELAQQLVEACDVLFVSHRHLDHADLWVAKAFLDAGKPVVAPPDVWKDEPLYSRVTHLPRDPDALQELAVQDGKQKIKVVAYPGSQGDGATDPLNNTALVISPENLVFVHTGDESSAKHWGWMDHIKDQYAVDVLMTDSWYGDVKRIIQGIGPKAVLSGHENELGHAVDHREPYWLSFVRLNGVPHPYYVLTWGERFDYPQ